MKTKPTIGLAAKIDKIHRQHKPGQHPDTVKFKGKTFRLGGPKMKHRGKRGA